MPETVQEPMEQARVSIQDQSLGQICIDTDAFGADLKINEGYQSYSAELLRLSLLAIAGISAVWMKLFVESANPRPSHSKIDVGLFVSALFLLTSAACAVYHRYSAADSLGYHLLALRRYARNRPAKGESKSDAALAKIDVHRRDKLFKRCARLLNAAVICLVLGVAAFVLTLAAFMRPGH